MSSNHSKDKQSLGLFNRGRDSLPRTPELPPSSPQLGGNLGRTTHEGLVPFGIERNQETERDEE
jgi:hypothetical protein